jgi:serine/threonine-protein kinase HipA
LTAELTVYLNNDYVGILSCDKQRLFSFQYGPEWIARKDVPPLSLSLPLRESAYPDEKARPFFTNLLPESFVREAVARKLGISLRNEFALLEALGGECAGAITLLPQGVALENQSGYLELSPEKFHKLIQELPKKPFLAGEAGIRLSLAGAQNKLPVYLEGGRLFLPGGASPSSHIIKPNIEGIEQSIRNEAFCMALAERIGLKVPRVHVMTDPDELYVVERYDRYRDENGQVDRLHQEDFCQAMGLMAETKYESEGGPSLADCFSLLDRFSTNPALDRKALLDWIVFNYFIHNADAHGKNLSLLLTPVEIRLAPFYDLMCTGVYEGINEKLAMKIGGENRPRWIRARHWERMAEEVGVGTKLVLRTLKGMAKRLAGAAEEVASEQQAIWGNASIIMRIQEVIASRVIDIRSF